MLDLKLSDEQKENALERANDQIRLVENYYAEDTNNPVAEFVSSFGYGDADRDDVNDQIDRILRFYGYTDDQIKQVVALGYDQLERLCDLDCRYLGHSDSIYARSVGEIEIELGGFTDDELKYLDTEICMSGSYTYSSSYDVWSLILDTDLVDDFLNNKGA